MFSKRNLLIAMVAIFGFAGLAAGCTAQDKDADSAVKSEHSSTDADMTHESSKGLAGLQAGLTAQFGQHVDLASAATRAGFDGRAEDFAAAAKSLDNNSVAISKSIGSVYGAEAEKQFLAVWRSHIGFFVDYTTSAKKGDKAGMDKAVSNLMGYVEASSDFLSKANPNLSKDVLKKSITEHVLQLKGAVDAYGAGDINKSYAEQEMAYMHMGELAHTLADAIAKQYPEKF
jgi:hypothetical protein